MQLILAVLVFLMAFCGFLLVGSVMSEAKRKKSLRARIVDENESSSGELPPQLMSGELSEAAASIRRFMQGMGIAVDTAATALEVRFARAGIDSKDGPIYYLFFQRFLSLGLGVLALVLMVSAKGDSTLLMRFVGFMLLVTALFGPKIYLQNMIDRRAKLLQRAFPDTLDLLLICVESGLALDAALTRVCNELARAYPEITQELNRTRLELAILGNRPRALMNLGERTGAPAFRSLVVALIQSEKFGTSLIDTLRVLSEDFRLARLASAEAKAARLPVLMTIPLIFLLLPAFFMIILGPAIIGMMRNMSNTSGQ